MSKIIYVPIKFDPEKITKKSLIKLSEDACEHVSTVAQKLQVRSRAGTDIKITFRISTDSSNKDVFFNASARRISESQYEIVIGAGLLYHLDIIAQTLVVDDSALKGLRGGRLLNREARKVGVEKILRDFNFHFLVGEIFWHEFAHVVLGHLDWLKQRKDTLFINELQMKPLPAREAADYQILEGDADRHAANWLLSSFDYGFSNNPYFNYRNEADKFVDFGFIVSSLFKVFDALEELEMPNATRTHPENDVRIMISMHYLSQYLEQYRGADAHTLKVACAKGARAARERTFHMNMRKPDEMDIVLKTFEVDFLPQQMGIREHQLQMSNGRSSITTEIQ